MLVSMDKTYRTRDGRKVVILDVMDGPDSENRDTDNAVIGKVQNSAGYWLPINWGLEGNFWDVKSSLDLIECRPRFTRTIWMNVYADKTEIFFDGEQGAREYTAPKKAILIAHKVEIDVELPASVDATTKEEEG